MSQLKKTAAVATLVGLSLTAGGCLFVDTTSYNGYGAHHRVTRGEMDDIVRQNTRLRLGADRDQALNLYPERAVSFWSSDQIAGYEVEEWRVRAYTKHRNTYFERWLYFVDGRLAAFNQEQIDYNDSDRVLGWATR
ncbi:MAG: hypothetical protein AAGB51_05890 [Planctomycetota bacterium]